MVHGKNEQISTLRAKLEAQSLLRQKLIAALPAQDMDGCS